MKTCVIYGDMSSELSGENYPTVQICDSCVEENEKLREDSRIVTVGAFDPSLGDTCEFCDATLEEEEALNS